MKINIDLSKIVNAEDKAAASRDAERAAIAARRWAAESGGMTFNGVAIHTDDRSRANILGAYLEAIEDPDYSVSWKSADGAFYTLDAAQVIALARALRAHVQACFNREAVILDAFDAGDPYDIDQGWP